MAEPFDNGELGGSIRQKINAAANEINTTRRDWYQPFSGTRCYHDGKRWNLASGGDRNDIPGTNASWVLVLENKDESSILWKPGNTLDRVQAEVAGETFIFNLRGGQDRSIAPDSLDGGKSWAIENRGILPFRVELGLYYEVGQVVYQAGVLYELLTRYLSPPTRGTDLRWKDIFEDLNPPAPAPTPPPSNGGSNPQPTPTPTPPPQSPNKTINITTTARGIWDVRATLNAGFSTLPIWDNAGVAETGVQYRPDFPNTNSKTIKLTVQTGSLKELRLGYRSITGIGIPSGTGIRLIDLSGNTTIPFGNDSLPFMPELEEIYVDGMTLSKLDSGLSSFNLKGINVQNTRSEISDASLASTTAPTRIHIGGVGTRVTAAKLASYSSLDVLNINTAVVINDSHTARWGLIRSLSAAYLPNTRITNSGLANMPRLTTLNLINTASNVTGSGIRSCPSLKKVLLSSASNDTDGVINSLASNAQSRGVRNGELALQGTCPRPSGSSSSSLQTLRNLGWTVRTN